MCAYILSMSTKWSNDVPLFCFVAIGERIVMELNLKVIHGVRIVEVITYLDH